MVFLPGTHRLTTNLWVSNLQNFTMNSKTSIAQILCTSRSHMIFKRSQYIHIANLEFIGCTENQIEVIRRFELQHTKFMDSGTALQLIETTARIFNCTFAITSNNATHGSTGAIYSIRSNLRIKESHFASNNATQYGAGLYSTSSDVIIEASHFTSNNANYGGAIYSSSSNVSIKTTDFISNSAIISGGVLYSHHSNITIEASKLEKNSAANGGILYSEISFVSLRGSVFKDNSAIIKGGVLRSRSSNISIKASEFSNNTVNWDGGVLKSTFDTIKIEVSELNNNTAKHGGVLNSLASNITIVASRFHNNTASSTGGVIEAISSDILSLEANEFIKNSASGYGGHGGVLYSSLCNNISMEGSKFNKNTADYEGGVMYVKSSVIRMGDCEFTDNNSTTGSVIHATRSSIFNQHGSLLIANNTAKTFATMYLIDTEFMSENITIISHNVGSLMAFKSNVTFKITSYNTFASNQPPINVQEGGAITLFQSNAFFHGICLLEHNHAENGGAIFSIDSKIYVTGNITTAHNTAGEDGGGVYLSNSELNLQKHSRFDLFNNIATHKGGGLHAISSSIESTSAASFLDHYTGSRLNFTGNIAKMGGGMSMEANAKLYISKYNQIYYEYQSDYNTVIFTANNADYGGALYVDDSTYSGTCVSARRRYCFFQVLAMYYIDVHIGWDLKMQSIHFSQNYANKLGSTLYGGLLDRCAVSQFAEVCERFYGRNFEADGISYFGRVSNTIVTDNDTSISSLPIKICHCNKEYINCTNQQHVEVEKGESFTLSIVAVDQIGQPVNATIQTSLNFTESGLAEGQLTREIPAKCTDLTFNVVSPHSSEQLMLYASDGPCKDAELSIRTIEIHFLPCTCPIGFQVSRTNNTNCTCECHSDINQHAEQCDSHTESFVKISQSRAWISYINDTNLTGFLVYSNCPFDYCNSLPLPINLNEPDGADIQCAFNRSSLLCGSCQPGISLSLGSSRCLSCPSHWPVHLTTVTIAGILAGIALVALLLTLNMTVAVGTLNGLIFYANILYANKTLLLQFQEINFMTVLVSWFNLDLGIDVCYFPGMDTYVKTWLQLAFPAYVILLVVLVIIISSYSSRFSNLIGKKDPVAMLATLILISYAKLLEVCFKSLSVGILVYPDGTRDKLWLPDATVRYLSAKYIPLFIVAVLILLVGMFYTAILFSWQWLLYLPNWKIFRNQKMKTFIETYHTPYTPKNRYWTGLLLVARAVLYLVAAVNISNNPYVALTAITFTMCCIVLLKGFFGSRVYRKWPLDILETFFYLHILFIAILTWYSLTNTEINQKAVSYTSVIIAFIVLLLIILYHVFTYTPVFSKIKTTKTGRKINSLFTDNADQKPKLKLQNLPPDDDIHRFNKLLDMIDRPVNTNDYRAELRQKPVIPTQSVVEVYNACLVPPHPEETNSAKMIVSAEV